MKPSTFLKRAAAAMATVFFFVAGAPCVSAADVTHDISSGSLTISTDGSYIVEGGGITTSNNITVNSGVTATITLKSVSITCASASALEFGSGAKVTLILEETNTLTSSYSAGILVPSDSTLIIQNSSKGDGTVKATGGYYAAGIGGGDGGSGGTVTISGGSVEATGGYYAAGIGGGEYGSGTVTISGGTVTATGGDYASGIGGGDDGGGTVTISGGTVTATGGKYGAGIGGGDGGSGGTVTISGGTVTAIGGIGGAGIGGGWGSGGTVTISGGTVTANGGDSAAGIGGGYKGGGGTVKISGSATAVTVTGGKAGYDIGAGYGKAPSDGGTLTVGDGAHLTLLTGMDNSILPKNVTLGNCIVDGPGAGRYKRPTNATSNSDESVETEAPVFLRSTNGSGVEIDISALALPAGVTLISKGFSGLPTQAAGKAWTLSQRLVGTNGTLRGQDYLSLYELSLTDENGKPITSYIGRVTVRLPIPSGSTEDLHLLYLDEATGRFTEMVAVQEGNYLTYSSTHFSSYLITNSGSTGEKPTIPETGAPSFPYATGAVPVLILLTASLLRKQLKH